MTPNPATSRDPILVTVRGVSNNTCLPGSSSSRVASTVAEVRAFDHRAFCGGVPPTPAPLQMSVSTVMKTFGRFSVGFRGVGLPDPD